MPYPHAIRLRGPWQLEPLARYVLSAEGCVESADNLPTACRTTVPADWGSLLGDDFRGRVRYRRTFNPPPSLHAHERIWLVVEGVDARGTVALNGMSLGQVPGYAIVANFDVTSLISSRNEVILDVELPPDSAGKGGPLRPGREALPGGAIGDVRLEIRSAQFIDRLAIWSIGECGHQQFVAAGAIGGEPADAGLAVVISGCQRELAYTETMYGKPFNLAFEAEEFPTWSTDRPTLAPIEVKLLSGGSAVWQRQIETGFRAAEAKHAALKLTQILSDSSYRDYDRAGTAVIQQVPLAWADEVCARLAHHPSVVAWSAGTSELPPPAPTAGRPWM
jgi:beta-galactosidase/beta-glucuronidase